MFERVLLALSTGLVRSEGEGTFGDFHFHFEEELRIRTLAHEQPSNPE